MSSEPSSAKSGRAGAGQGSSNITAENVAAYLKEHPEFFVDRDELLAEMQVPHESGKAISLLERQVHILRERSIESRHTLNSLMENARYNDQLFNITRNLILTLLEEDDVQQVVSITEANLCTQPGIDACTLIVFDPTVQPGRSIPENEIQQRFPSLFRSRNIVCQQADREVARLIFPGHNSTIRSIALCPIRRDNGIIGVLALGNHSRDHFNQQLDTLFLDFIADVLGSVISNKKPAQ